MLVLFVIVICLSLILLTALATKRRSAITAIKMLPATTIPKSIMMTWKTELNESSPTAFLRNFNTVKRLHPDWHVVFLDDNGVEEFMGKAHPMFLEAYRRCDLRIQQIDIFRMAYVYAVGGFYLDCDVALSKPLDELLPNAAVFPQELSNTDGVLEKRGCAYRLGNYAFGAIPGHGLFIKYVERARLMIQQLKIRSGEANNKRRVFYTTGTVALTMSYLDYMESSTYSNNPAHDVRMLKGAGNARFGDFGLHQLTGTWKNKPLSSGNFKIIK
jgi:mannosyltransferase OCH1-like enzyme